MAYSDEVLALGPVAYWRLGEPSGTVAEEETGVHDGTYVNSPTLGVTGALLGDADTAVTFNGTNQYVTAPHSTAFNLGDAPLSIVAWVKIGAATTAVQFFFHRANDSYGLGWDHSTDKFWFSKANSTRIAEDTGTITDTDWHMLVATRTGSASGQTKLYKDGVDVTSFLAVATLVDPAGSVAVGISGRSTGANLFGGSIDEVAIFDYALSQTEVEDLYAAGMGAAGEPVSVILLGGL